MRSLELPRVVIGIPTFNRATSLARAIESALAQDYPDLAVLISDNASTDATREVCAAFVAADPRVAVTRQQSNVGATKNFRSVFESASGELFMWLADDDWLDAGYVRRCVECLVQEPDVVLVGGRAKYYQNGVLTRTGAATNCQSNLATRRVLQYYCGVDDNAIFYGVMRRQALMRQAIPNCLGGDWLLIAAMAYQGKIKTIEDAFLHRALGGASVSLDRMIRALDLPRWQARIPLTFTLAVYAARDIGWNNPVYADRSPISRRVFALLVFCWLFSIKPVQELWRRIRARLVFPSAAAR